MKYLLKYRDLEIGTVEGTDADFMNLSGTFNVTEFEDKPLKQFISLSIRESDLIEEDHLRDISDEMTELQDEMEAYLHFIESEDWKLINEQQEILKILVPSFKSDNTIVWRWGL